jgi:hypothetical protein
MGGAVLDSHEVAQNSNISTPPIINDLYQQKELAMLNLINSNNQNGSANLMFCTYSEHTNHCV